MGENTESHSGDTSGRNLASVYQQNDALFAQISARFLNSEPDQVQTNTLETLRILREYCDAQSTAIIQFDGTPDNAVVDYLWPNDPANRAQWLMPAPAEWLAPYMAKIQDWETVIISSVSDIPLEATEVRTEALSSGFRRLILVPLFLRKQLRGVLALLGSDDGRQAWREEIIPLLRNVANALVAALSCHQCHEEHCGSASFYRACAEQNAEGLALASPETGKLVFANPAVCRLTGYEMDDLLQLTINELHPEPSPIFLKVLTTWEPAIGEEEIVRRDGQLLPVEIAAFPVSIDGRQLILGSIRDISSRKEIQKETAALDAQIQKAQKLESLGVLAGGIAHDFNNLLVGILGNAGLALMDLSPESPVRDCMHEIELTAKRAADLVKQMLAYSGKGQFIIERIGLPTLVEEMAHLLNVSISKNVVLKYKHAPGTPPVEADAAQLRQVILNLVTNASEAIAECSGVISVSTGAIECDRAYLAETYLDEDLPEGVYAFIEVSDSGCGMTHEVRDKVFDPFFSTKFAGRGLGLAAVLGIMRGHRGAIKIYSEPGSGTTVKVLLPALDDSAVTRDSRPPFNLADSERFEGTVLLVDDEETVRAVGRRMLERLGFDVITAVDGREGIEIFKRDPDKIDRVLLDLTMPNVDGEQCFRELRRIRKDVCVVLSSGYSEQELQTRFMGKGLAGFIQKPYQISTLAEVFANLKC